MQASEFGSWPLLAARLAVVVVLGEVVAVNDEFDAKRTLSQNDGLDEVWLPVVGDENYEVSSEGRIRRVGGKVLSPWVQRGGYLQINLTGKRRVYVHRVVCEAFHGGGQGLQVNHINGQRDCNAAENLEWVTCSENHRHSHRVLGRHVASRGKFSADHPTSKPVIARDPTSGEEKYYASGMDAVRAGYRSDSISRCCTGKSFSHGGLQWRFAGTPS